MRSTLRLATLVLFLVTAAHATAQNYWQAATAPATGIEYTGNVKVAGNLTLTGNINDLSIALPYYQTPGYVIGYVKLVTPLSTGAGAFNIRVRGFRTAFNQTFHIDCGSWLLFGTPSVLSAPACTTDGTDLPVELTKETRGASEVVVLRIGTPTTNWSYHSGFIAEYTGATVFAASGFQWVAGETAPAAPVVDMNRVSIDDMTGKIVARGTTAGAHPVYVDNTDLTGYSVIRVNASAETAKGGALTSVGTSNTSFAGTALAAGSTGVIGYETAGLSLVANNATDSAIRLYTAGYAGANERMRISHAGNVGVGVTAPTEKLHVGGNIHATGNITAGGAIAAKYQDVAEWVPASDDLMPGTVVVLSGLRANEVTASSSPYDTKVAGVVTLQPGIILGEAAPGSEQIATTGRVKVRVDATGGAIAIGDLLVTSDKSGTAMKSQPMPFNGRSFHQPGTIVGKALEALPSGSGEILVLLSLQ